MNLGVAAYAQIAVGAFLAILGVIYLVSTRRIVRRGLDENATQRCSYPTKYLTSAWLLVLGYHLVVWALPITVTPLQMPRQWWWLPPVLAVSSIAVSAWMDRREPPSTE